MSLAPVMIESPYAPSKWASVEDHVLYARRCLAHSLAQREAPFASHLLYTQKGVLDDTRIDQRAAGIVAGFSWYPHARGCKVYTDYGISWGMEKGIELARKLEIDVEYRSIGQNGSSDPDASLYAS